MGFKIGIKRTIKNNPIRFVFASVFSLCVISLSTLGVLWLSYTTYALGVAKNIFTTATGATVDISSFQYNIRTNEFVFKNVIIHNSTDFETKSASISNSNLKDVDMKDMAKIDELRVKADFLSVLGNSPKLTEIDMKISKINAIRITPRMFNLLMFFDNISEVVSISENGIKKFSFNIEKSKTVNATYIDFSSKKDVIILERNDAFSFERSDVKDVKKMLKELSDELSAKTQLQFLSRAINNFLE